MRRSRAIGLIGAFALALQAIGAVPMPARSCCCAARAAKCHCPVCAHAGEIESGGRFVQGCAPSSQPSLAQAAQPALPPSQAIAAQRVAAPLPDLAVQTGAPEPPLDVPTPPPLRA